MRLLLFISIVLISYGSLYPFNFRDTGISLSWEIFFLTNPEISSSSFSNIAANIVLFIPYGFFGYLSTIIPRTPKTNLIAIIFLGLLLSYILQLLQILLPTRLSEWNDIVWNMIGLALGGLVAVISRNILLNSSLFFKSWLSPQGLLIGAWLAAILIPFVPSLSIDIIRENVKQLLTGRDFSYLLTFTQMAYWVTVAFLIESIVGKKRVRVIFPILLSLSLSAKLILVDNPLQIAHLLGAILSLLIWFPASELASKQTKLQSIILLLFMATILSGLFPFEIKTAAMAFHWIPFYGFLNGDMLHNSLILCEKIFIYGALIWIFVETGNSARVATIIIAIWLLLIEISQIFLGEHTPEITDPILAIIVSFIIFQIKPPKEIATHSSSPSEPKEQFFSEITWEIKWQKFALILASLALIISIAIYSLLALPNIPYNIKELFLYNGNFVVVYIFSLAILWTGISSYLSSHCANKHRFQSLALLGYIVLSGFVSLTLLKLSVSSESISDITGSSNMMWQVTGKKIWGDLGAKLFLTLNTPGMIAFIERIIRYLTLFTPLLLTIAIFNTLFIRVKDPSALIRKTGSLVLVSLPWFFLCKLVTFDYSSTDNLNELIARPGEYGLGGGGYLYLLMILIAFNVAFLSRATHSFLSISGILITILAIPAGWYLLNEGLVTDFHKYNQVYSGVDFLLGPDRRNLLPDSVLFVRWSILQVGLVVILTAGQRLASLLIAPSKKPLIDKSMDSTIC